MNLGRVIGLQTSLCETNVSGRDKIVEISRIREQFPVLEGAKKKHIQYAKLELRKVTLFWFSQSFVANTKFSTIFL